MRPVAEPSADKGGEKQSKGGRGGGGGFGPADVRELKWTEEDFADAKDGKLPMGELPDNRRSHWSYGDVEAGFKNAALVLDETFVTPNTSHQCLETRTAMAYWQNGKVFVHTGTQSTAQTVPAIARWLGLLDEKGLPDASKVVFISEYTGGGFGSKITGAISLIIPGILSKKTGAPVMMRITREEEHYIGTRAAQPDGADEGRLLERRQDPGARYVRVRRITVPTIRTATRRRRDASFRCCINRNRCAGAGSRC